LRLIEQSNKARTDAEKEATGIEDAAMAKERTAQESAIESAKQYASDREERLKKREEGQKGAEKRNVNTTFIEAGLAIMAGESSNALLNIAKGARQGLRGYEERLEKINANKEKLDEDFSRLYELRQERVDAAGEKLRGIDKEIAGLKANAKRTFGQLASDLAGQKINVGMKQLEAAESRFNAGVSSNTPNNQLFADLVAKNKGDKVAAYKQYSAMTSKGDGLAPGMDKYLDKLLERRIELETAPFLTDQQKTALVGLNNQIARITGGGGAGGGNAFTVSVGGKTYTFPTQEAANKFKAEAGVK
jgi:archaellum component FlaC